MMHDFDERLSFSLGERGKRDAEILRRAIPNCIDVRKTDEETDRKGIDYIVTLEGGAEINVDVKSRDKGISRYWKDGKEDLALETWSVCKTEKNEGKIGWTLSDKTNVDFILYTFDESDSKNYYLFPYQLLRMAFKRNKDIWIAKYGRRYAYNFSYNASWSTENVFVPATEIMDAIRAEMKGLIKGSEES